MNNRILRADRGVSLLLAGERGARGHAVQPAPHAPLAQPHAARAGAGHAAAHAAPALVHRHADAGAGAARAAGAGAAAPAQHPGGLPPGAAGRPHRARRARPAAAAGRLAARRQRHALLHRL